MVSGFEDSQLKFMQSFITEMKMLNDHLENIEDFLEEMRDEFRAANERQSMKDLRRMQKEE